MMGVELFVQVFLDSALLSACVFGTLGWQGRLMNCVLAGNFVICLLSRLTGYSTDPVSYAVVPLDNFVYVLFLLLAVLLLNSVCFDSGEAHIFWGTTMQFALFLLLREVCFVVLGLLDLSVGFLACIWGTYTFAPFVGGSVGNWIAPLDKRTAKRRRYTALHYHWKFFSHLVACLAGMAGRPAAHKSVASNHGNSFGIIGFDRRHGSSLGSEPHPISTQRAPVGAVSSHGGRIGGVCTSPTA